MKLDELIIVKNKTIIDAMRLIENNRKRFVIVVDENNVLFGTLTDGDIRRALINNYQLNDLIAEVAQKSYQKLNVQTPFQEVILKFKQNNLDFLPIVDNDNKVINVLTKEQLHELLLQSHSLDLSRDFRIYDNKTAVHEIYDRPWGFYKTVFLSEFAQAKVLHVLPEQRLSLQYHEKREEHWIIVKGQGKMTIGESVREMTEGSYIFIPKGCKHRIENTSFNTPLIISEIQLGTYFGEDDIIRIEDIYGRIEGEL